MDQKEHANKENTLYDEVQKETTKARPPVVLSLSLSFSSVVACVVGETREKSRLVFLAMDISLVSRGIFPLFETLKNGQKMTPHTTQRKHTSVGKDDTNCEKKRNYDERETTGADVLRRKTTTTERRRRRRRTTTRTTKSRSS
jgi:hypothetical protein